MNILYCGDEQITDGLLISVLSLLKRVKEPLHVYVFTFGLRTPKKCYKPISEAVIHTLDEAVKEKNASGFVKMLDLTERIEQDYCFSHGSICENPEKVLKLYADCIPQMPKRLLYLDHTVVCCRDCSAFYHQDMSEYEVAAVLQKRDGFFFGKNMIEDGVLLWNMTMLRETKVLEAGRAYCSRACEQKGYAPVQEAIDLCMQAKKICKRQYNEQKMLYIDTVFQHITTCHAKWFWKQDIPFEPWNTQQVHQYLKVAVHDTLLQEYQMRKKEIQKGSD